MNEHSQITDWTQERDSSAQQAEYLDALIATARRALGELHAILHEADCANNVEHIYFGENYETGNASVKADLSCRDFGWVCVIQNPPWESDVTASWAPPDGGEAVEVEGHAPVIALLRRMKEEGCGRDCTYCAEEEK